MKRILIIELNGPHADVGAAAAFLQLLIERVDDDEEIDLQGQRQRVHDDAAEHARAVVVADDGDDGQDERDHAQHDDDERHDHPDEHVERLTLLRAQNEEDIGRDKDDGLDEADEIKAAEVGEEREDGEDQIGDADGESAALQVEEEAAIVNPAHLEL